MSDRETSRGMSEDMLHAYADGQLAPEQRDAVEAWIAAHPDDARRLSAWQAQNDAIRGLFPLSAGHRSLPRRIRTSTIAGRTAVAAGLLAAFLAGTGAGFGLAGLRNAPQMSPIGIAEASRVNYLVYASEVRHPVEVRSDEKDHLVAWLGKRIGGTLQAPDLGAEGFTLVGGRLVTYGDGPGAMLMYEDTTGARLTMLTARSGSNSQTGFRFDRSGDVNTFYWIDGPFGFALSGSIPRERLEQVAEAVYRQL